MKKFRVTLNFVRYSIKRFFYCQSPFLLGELFLHSLFILSESTDIRKVLLVFSRDAETKM